MLYTCLLEDRRDEVLQGMLDAGIEARLYFPPAHRQKVFRADTPHLPVTVDLAARMISLPMHSRLLDEELADIADTLESLLEG
jgi:perosamine synthetase